MAAIDFSTDIGKARMYVGDIGDEKLFEDTVYQQLLDAGKSPIETAIELLEAAITHFAMMPTRERAGAYEVYSMNIQFLDSRLDELKKKRYGATKTPVVINPGQKSWDWLDTIFGGECK